MPFGVLVDPNAPGTKVSSFVSFAYDYEVDTPRSNACESMRWVKNLHVIATVQKGNDVQAFQQQSIPLRAWTISRTASKTRPSSSTSSSIFIDRVVIAEFYNCVPGGCPPYAVKSIKNFLSTGVGGASLEVELAVRVNHSAAAGRTDFSARASMLQVASPR